MSDKIRFIYVIGPAVGPLKIGIATYLKDRLSSIQTGSHVRLSVLFSIKVPAGLAQRIEQAAHKIICDRRMSGEWFDATKEQAISAVISAKNAAEADLAAIEADIAKKASAEKAKIDKAKAELLAKRIKETVHTDAVLVTRMSVANYEKYHAEIAKTRDAPRLAFVNRMQEGRRRARAEKADAAALGAWLAQ